MRNLIKAIVLSLIVINTAYAKIHIPVSVGGYQFGGPPLYSDDKAKAKMNYGPVTVCTSMGTPLEVSNRFPNAAIIIMVDCTKIKVKVNADGSIDIK